MIVGDGEDVDDLVSREVGDVVGEGLHRLEDDASGHPPVS